MDSEASFSSVWNQFEDFELPAEQPDACAFAQKFSEWVGELCAKVTREPSLVSVNQAKILLVDKYFEWRSVVPRSHRNRLGSLGHRCIFQVFAETYERLKAVELALTPPMLFIPPQPPPPAPLPPSPQIAGIFLGELDKS